MQQRLFEIVYLLTQRGKIPAGEFAARFGVSRRTIYRDVDTLSAAGIPVYAQKGHGGGICILPDFVLDKTLFSKEEQRQLLSHFHSLAALGTPDTQPVLDKLAALFGGGGASWLEVDLAPWGNDAARSVFRLLREAILAKKLVRFQYASATASGETRTAEPYKIVFRGQGWYLYAFCTARADFRFFKLSRLSALEILPDSFAPRTVPADTAPPSPSPAAPITLHFRATAAFRVYDEFPAEQITPQPDGSFLVHTTFPLETWGIGYLLSFGPDAKVLHPAALRRRLAQAIQQMSAQYPAE